jgi:hypothetical protein
MGTLSVGVEFETSVADGSITPTDFRAELDARQKQHQTG